MTPFLSFVIYLCTESGISADHCLKLFKDCKARHETNLRLGSVDDFCANSLGNMALEKQRQQCQE